MEKQLFRSSRYSQSASLLVGSQGIFPQAGPSLWYVITECCFAAYRSGLHHSDTSKSQSAAYCFAQLKQGTCLIRLKKQPSLLPEDELPRDTTSIHPHLAAQTSVGTPIPRRCNRRTCHVLTARSFSWSICRSDMPLRSHLPHPILHPVSPFGNSL